MQTTRISPTTARTLARESDSGRYSAINTAIVARRAEIRAARVAEDCKTEARRVRRALATVLAHDLRRCCAIGGNHAMVFAMLAGPHQEALWRGIGEKAGEAVPVSAGARAKIISMAKAIAAGKAVQS